MTHTDDLDNLLQTHCNRLGASSCTFYIQDPYWEEEFRLVSMPGVKFREPMFGWIFDERARKLFCDDAQEVYSSDSTPELPLEEFKAILAANFRSSMFQGFAGREGVQSFARLHHKSHEDKIDAVLFVNFSEKVSFIESLRQSIREVFALAVEVMPFIMDELRQAEAERLAESIRILRATQSLAGSLQGFIDEKSSLSSRFRNLLKRSLESVAISQEDGLATIHLYDSNRGMLQLNVLEGNRTFCANLEATQTSGDGIVAWAAIMRKSLLIHNLANSQFASLASNINPEIKSRLAVPMIANGEVIGVLNLESKNEAAFDSAGVRSLWYSANVAAAAFKSAQRAQTTRRLLEICDVATKDENGAEQALIDIANVLKSTLSADSCDIWHFNSSLGRFNTAKATYQDFTPSIRPDGWTAYVGQTKCPVWIDGIQGETEFSATFWNGQQWGDLSIGKTPHPAGINKKLVDRGAEADFGLPIMVSSQCVGVAWIKYFRGKEPQHVQAPPLNRMKETFSVASQAGLVLELIQRQSDRPHAAQLQRIGEKLTPFSTSRELLFGQLPLKGHIVHRRFHTYACGDFHAMSHMETVTGLLIGDGEGKAVAGLLNALPLITCFEVFGKSSGSTSHVIDRLRGVSRKLGLAGTAIYFTFTEIHGDVWLAMTSAGHELPILVRPGPPFWAGNLPKEMDNPSLGTALGWDIDSPQVEYHEKLMAGDVLIAYTDGVSDAFSGTEGDNANTDGDTPNIASIVMSKIQGSPQQIAEAIMSAAEKVNPLADDATVCVIRRLARAEIK